MKLEFYYKPGQSAFVSYTFKCSVLLVMYSWLKPGFVLQNNVLLTANSYLIASCHYCILKPYISGMYVAEVNLCICMWQLGFLANSSMCSEAILHTNSLLYMYTVEITTVAMLGLYLLRALIEANAAPSGSVYYAQQKI